MGVETMSDVISFINSAIDEWYQSGKKISPKGFVLKKGRCDSNFDEIELWYNDPDGPLVENPDWGMIPIFNANRKELRHGPNSDQLYSTIDDLRESDITDLQKVINLAS